MLPESMTYMVAPLVVCATITGLLTYLGIHVLCREIIFVDLALAQIAALGATYAFFLGLDPTSDWASIYSLGFALLGAALFAFVRPHRSRVPQEAIIGIAYAVASGTSILLVDLAQDPHGSEKIQYLLVGNLVWVTWPEVIRTVAVCAVVGLFHYLVRRPLLLVSFNPLQAENEGYSIKLWDFLFYFSFAIAITSIVHLTGVLLIFSFLIIPAAVGTLFANRIAGRLLIGWAVGLVVSFFGLWLSYDRPSGPMIVSLFGLCLLVLAAARYLLSAPSRPRALGILAAGAGGTSLVLLGIPWIGGHLPSGEHHHAAAAAEEHQEPVKTEPTTTDSADPETRALLKQLRASDSVVRQEAIERLRGQTEPVVLDGLREALETEPDPGLQIELAKALYEGGEKKIALNHLVGLLRDSPLPFVRLEAVEYLRDVSGQELGFEPMASADENAEALARWEAWVLEIDE